LRRQSELESRKFSPNKFAEFGQPKFELTRNHLVEENFEFADFGFFFLTEIKSSPGATHTEQAPTKPTD